MMCSIVSTPKLLAKVQHPSGLELEHTHCLPAAQEIERCRVIKRHGGEIEVRHPLPDEVLRILDDREGLQAEEIHLQHAEFGQRVHRELRHDLSLVAARQRDVLVEGRRADHHARSVHAGAAGESLEFDRVAPKFGGGGFLLDRGRQFLVFPTRLPRA